MDHGLMDISGDSFISKIVNVDLSKYNMCGWKMFIETADFRFSPNQVNQVHLPGHGHAHLYINDEKLARIYASHFHIPALMGGENRLKVTLNANGHETMAIGAQAIEHELELTQ